MTMARPVGAGWPLVTYRLVQVGQVWYRWTRSDLSFPTMYYMWVCCPKGACACVNSMRNLKSLRGRNF